MKQFIVVNFRISNMLFFIALILSAGCLNNRNVNPDEIIAQVEDTYLTRDVVMSLLPENLRPREHKLFIRRIVDQWIDNQVLAKLALKEGVELSARDLWQIDHIEKEILASNYLAYQLNQQSLAISENEISTYYRVKQNSMKRTHKEAHLVHLFLENNDSDIMKEIKRSNSLLEVIHKHSSLNNPRRMGIEPNGDLGYVRIDLLRPEFKKAIKDLNSKQIIGPIRTREGYHYLQILGHKPAGSTRSINEVRKEILQQLRLKKREQQIKFMKEKAKRFFIVKTFYENIL